MRFLQRVPIEEMREFTDNRQLRYSPEISDTEILSDRNNHSFGLEAATLVAFSSLTTNLRSIIKRDGKNTHRLYALLETGEPGSSTQIITIDIGFEQRNDVVLIYHYYMKTRSLSELTMSSIPSTIRSTSEQEINEDTYAQIGVAHHTTLFDYDLATHSVTIKDPNLGWSARILPTTDMN